MKLIPRGGNRGVRSGSVYGLRRGYGGQAKKLRGSRPSGFFLHRKSAGCPALAPCSLYAGFCSRTLRHGDGHLSGPRIAQRIDSGGVAERWNRREIQPPNSSLQHLEFAVMPRLARGQPRFGDVSLSAERSSSLWHCSACSLTGYALHGWALPTRRSFAVRTFLPGKAGAAIKRAGSALSFVFPSPSRRILRFSVSCDVMPIACRLAPLIFFYFRFFAALAQCPAPACRGVRKKHSLVLIVVPSSIFGSSPL